jgi:hypothetical protein
MVKEGTRRETAKGMETVDIVAEYLDTVFAHATSGAHDD